MSSRFPRLENDGLVRVRTTNRITNGIRIPAFEAGARGRPTPPSPGRRVLRRSSFPYSSRHLGRVAERGREDCALRGCVAPELRHELPAPHHEDPVAEADHLFELGG